MTAAISTPRHSDHKVAPALAQRLRAVAEVLLPDALDGLSGTNAEQAGTLLEAMAGRIHRHPASDELWLLFTAVAAAFPTEAELLDARRFLQHANEAEAAIYLLEAGYASALNGGTPHLEMDLVVDTVVADVDFCASNDHHTGIQRVVRETMPRWVRDHDVTLVAWTDAHGAMRDLAPEERDRVLRWAERSDAEQLRAETHRRAKPVHRLVVPWRSRVILPENPEPQRCPSIAALAQYSGNTVAAIGYDCIPVVSPDLIHPGLPDRFMQYLAVIKHAHVVAGISSSATAEFRGFARMMPSQGLPGPRVVEVALPVEVPGSAVDSLAPDVGGRLPLVISVGSFEPRKNQLAVLLAAERLWREGLRFELRFIGGGGWRTEFDAIVNRLARAGRPVGVAVKVSDQELWATYRRARFSVFASLHEGYGLPVAESLAYGVPALTTSYGSTAEIAREGGALLVDPRDDDAIAAQMRRLLTDDALLAQLKDEAVRRPKRCWDDYARELWSALAAEGAA